MADTAPKAENGKGNGEKKERRGGKGGGRGEGRGEGGKGRAPRKPRPEIPTFDDPEEELKKMGEVPPKPNRDLLDTKIQRIQNEIDTSKKRTDAITADLEAIRQKTQELKSKGAAPMEACREAVRDLKKQIVGIIEERKRISGRIDELKEKKNSMDDAIKKQKANIGRFSSNEAIDEEIRRIEDYMAHNSIDLKAEKDCMVQIKELNKKRDDVKALEQMEGKRSIPGTVSLSLPDLYEARKKVDGRLDELRTQEKAAVDALQAQRDKTQSKDSERFEKLIEERKVIRDKISERIGAIRQLRSEYQAEDDKWYEHDRLAKNLKWQIREKNKKEREEKQKQWEEEKKTKQAEWEAEREYRKNFDEDGNPREKLIDWDLAERITLCEQLITFLQQYQPKEENESATKATGSSDGRQVEKPTDVKAYTKNAALKDDPLGLNAFMVEEVVSKRSKKKEKKKQQKKEELEEMIQDGDVPLQLSLEMIQQFANMGLAVPVNSDDCEGSIAQLNTKKAYYEEKGEAGLTLKELLKEERDAKKGGGKKADKKAEKKEEVAAESAEFDLEAARKAAQGTQLSEEEKKARGLLYDTSKASAVRDESESEEDEGDADFAGGDPFEGL